MQMRCNKCGEQGHSSEARDENKDIIERCQNPIKCYHCGGKHIAGHKDCPKYKMEKKICEEMATNKCSRADAKNKVNQTEPAAKSFAAAAKTPAPLPASSVDSIKDMIEKILEERLPKPTPKDNGNRQEDEKELLIRVKSLEEERKKDKETIKRLENQISQVTKSPTTNNEEIDAIKE